MLRLFLATVTYAGLMRGARDESIGTFGQPFGLERRPADRTNLARTFAPFEPGTSPSDGWTEEPLTDEVGDLIVIRYRGMPSRKRYDFIRDYLDLKIQRLERDS